MNETSRQVAAIVSAAALALAATGCAVALRAGSSVPEVEDGLAGAEALAAHGAAYFAFGDFGSLSAGSDDDAALPWVLASTLVTLLHVDGDVDAVDAAALSAAYRRFGFLTPTRIDNWPAGLAAPALDAPLGLNVATATRTLPPLELTLSNLSCASCHSSVRYGADGTPDVDGAWIGGSNSSIDPEGYVRALDAALRRFGDDERLERAMARLHPDTGLRERLTLRWLVRPALERRAARLRARHGALVAYRLSVPGATNGLDALRARLGLLDPDAPVGRSAFNSVPELGGRIWRTNLLYTGAYAIRGEDAERTVRAADITDEHLAGLAALTAFVTVPTMGVAPERAAAGIDEARAILAWMDRYEAQPFPGDVDRALAEDGRRSYAARCAGCHGRYGGGVADPELVEFPNARADVGTDPLAAALFDRTVAERVEATAFGEHIDATVASAYRAPPLTGLWASAPYLHNGSVPTLWHLMRPERRPRSFAVGGHALDFERVGILGGRGGASDGAPDTAYPAGYVPWSTPGRIDTSVEGFGNAGHEAPFDAMGEAEKTALLEYLKLL